MIELSCVIFSHSVLDNGDYCYRQSAVQNGRLPAIVPQSLSLKMKLYVDLFGKAQTKRSER